MRKKSLILLAITLLATSLWAASQEAVLHNFKNNGKDGYIPYAGVIFDTTGNLFGTTFDGGAHGAGTVFEMSPKTGGWNEKVLHNFGTAKDGNGPSDSLVFDSVGNLYGTTRSGGAYSSCGTVFELSPTGDGEWTEKVLHNFGSRNDGCVPDAGLTFDPSGNLYGTTTTDGAKGSAGIVFQLSRKTSGGWTEKVVHSFIPSRGDGADPSGSLLCDSAGNLYGTTAGGGAYGYGTVFELSPEADGGWTETILRNFAENGKNGYSPSGSLVFDAVGNLYGVAGGGSGTCVNGGYAGCGIVFELTQADGWTEEVLHSFDDNGTDGTDPNSLTFDAAGNLYGSTVYGGSGTCTVGPFVGCGTVFKLVPHGGARWTEIVLYSFKNNDRSGYSPEGVTFDGNGNVYGTTRWGGAPGTGCPGQGCGTVFEITP